MLKLISRSAAAALLAAVLLHAPARAQMMGVSSGDSDSQRRQYLGTVYSDIESMVGDWRKAVDADDARRLLEFYHDDAMVLTAGDSAAKGKTAVRRAMQRLLPMSRGFQTRMTDFTASGDMAYYAGKYIYFLDLPGGVQNVREGTFVMVLFQQGRTWRIRSYVETPDPMLAAAETGAPAPAGTASADTAAPEPEAATEN